MDCCWTSIKLQWYIFSVVIVIHGLPRGIEGESSPRCNIKDHTNVIPETNKSLSSSKASHTKAKTPHAGELEQEDGTKDYSGWRVLRLLSPAQVNVSQVLQALESSHGVVVLRVTREESRVAVSNTDVVVFSCKSFSPLSVLLLLYGDNLHFYL